MSSLLKKVIIILVGILVNISFIQAQEIPANQVKYYVWVKKMGEERTSPKSVLTLVNDQSIDLVIKQSQKDISYSYSEIDKIYFREKNAVQNGIGAGMAIGAAAGFLIGFASGDDTCEGWCILTFTAEQKGLMMAVPGTLLGGIIGAAVGSSRITININGVKSEFDTHKAQLKRFVR